MTTAITRRSMLGATALGCVGTGSLFGAIEALAAGTDTVTIGWPSDVPTWDPNQRFSPDAQPIYKMVFDQPLDQDPKLKLVPKLIKSGSSPRTARACRSSCATTSSSTTATR